MSEWLKSSPQVLIILSHHHHLVHVLGIKEFLPSKKIEKHTSNAENVTLFVELFFIQNLRRNVSKSPGFQVVFVPLVDFALPDREGVVTEEDRRVSGVFTDDVLGFNVSVDESCSVENFENLEELLKNGFKHFFSVTGRVGLNVVKQVTSAAFF